MEGFVAFSGWDERQQEAAEVFKYSLVTNSTIQVDFRFLKLHELPMQRQGRTSFSYSRFLCAALVDYRGRCAVFDGCDMLCLGDVAELAGFDMQGKPIAVVKHTRPGEARPRSWTSLMLMDCAQLRMLTPERAQRWPDEDLMRLRFLADHEIADLPPEWNLILDVGQEPPEGTKIAHWSPISDPDIGPWIDASKSDVWHSWREQWRGSLAAPSD